MIAGVASNYRVEAYLLRSPPKRMNRKVEEQRVLRLHFAQYLFYDIFHSILEHRKTTSFT